MTPEDVTEFQLTANACPIEVGSAGSKGRGVFARRDIAPGEIVEVSHVVPIPKEPTNDHAFWWGEDSDCLAMGKVSFVNHSDKPNCRLSHDFDALTISLIAAKSMATGEELSIDYDVPLWFRSQDEGE